MTEPWIGVRKLAVVPTFNTQFDPPPPADWNDQVARRVFYDPDPITGIDRSLRAYIEAISYGRAILEAKLFPFAFSDGPSVFEAAADSLPDGHGYEYLLCVIPMFDGDANRKGYFEVLTRNGVTFRAARVAMKDGPFREVTGVWAMEVLHAMAEWPDLYTYKFRHPLPSGTGEMNSYDNMTYNSGTHSCAELKLRVGWLKPGDMPAQDDVDGTTGTYDLHAIGLSGPPPGRVASVSFPSPRASNSWRVEARLRSDVYERGFASLGNGLEFVGLPAEGVVLYEVGQDPDAIFLVKVLQVGETFATNRSSVTVLAAIQDGFTVSVQTNPSPYISGRLLFYRDLTQNGTGDVSNPSVIGLGGWQNFKFLFSGGNGIIYAVDQDGRLLFYRDTTQNGTGDVANPSVIGQGGWQNFKFLFSGGNGIIYAVDQAGQLLFYRDTTQNGTGDVANPSVIGLGGWQNFKFLFSGGNGIIYAVVA